LSLYLDASVLVPLFIAETRTNDAHFALQGQELFISDLAEAEFSAAIAKRVRVGDLTAAEATSVYATFDVWTARAASRARIESGDMAATVALVRRLELSLRMPDAANIAIAQRLDAKMFTFDNRLAAAAGVVGLDVMS
jgi:predicted nucleic acid-binding protein